MNKKIKTSLIIATSFMLVGMIVFASVMTILGWDFKKLETAEFETSSYEIDESFSSISINADTSDIVFVPSENQESKVVCYTEKKVNHTVVVKDGTLIIDTEDKRKWYDYISVFSFSTSKITVYIPADKYYSLSIKNSTGDIEIPDSFSFKNIYIAVSTGDISCKALALENIKIETSTGTVEFYNATAKNIDISTATGDVTLSNIVEGGSVSVECDTGDVKLNDCDVAEILIETDTGDITLNNAIAAGTISIKSDTGDVKFKASDAAEIFVETDTGDVSGTILSGKVFIVSTHTGDVSVPESATGGKFKITTDTGDIELKVTK